jgi:hypothetical protein
MEEKNPNVCLLGARGERQNFRHKAAAAAPRHSPLKNFWNVT